MRWRASRRCRSCTDAGRASGSGGSETGPYFDDTCTSGRYGREMHSRLALLTPALLTLPLNGCFSSCANDIVRKEMAPDGNALEAFVFQRACGATTGFSTQISVL